MTEDVNQPESSFEETPKLNSSYQLLPDWFIEELRSFVSPDHDFALMYRDASPTEAVKMIGDALELTKEKFTRDTLAWDAWWKDEKALAEANTGHFPYQGSAPVRSIIIFGKEQGWPAPDHIMKKPGRWKHYINDRATAFYFLNYLVPNNNGDLCARARPMALSLPLALLDGVPSPNPVEVACRIANRLTARTSSWKKFQLKTFKPGGPNYRASFLDTVAFQMIVVMGKDYKKPDNRTVRGYLEQGGYEHPWYVTLVEKGKHWKGGGE